MRFVATKNGQTERKKFSPSSFDAVVGYGIRDPRSGIWDFGRSVCLGGS
jgi:hypothetical protein